MDVAATGHEFVREPEVSVGAVLQKDLPGSAESVLEARTQLRFDEPLGGIDRLVDSA